MEKVRKVFYDPLLRDKAQIQNLLSTLPIGSAHPFRGELLVHSEENLIAAVDISMRPDSYFTNAVSLDELGSQVLSRMALFPRKIGVFNQEYQIQQAPASSFQIPIVDGLIHIFAVSLREPSFYDLCVGDSNFGTSCYCARHTFNGMRHSGDKMANSVLLQYLRLNADLDETTRAVFVSGYHNYALHKYKRHNPLVIVANHSTKTLYVVPVPLDKATIGREATICCPLVIKKNAQNNTLQCTILPTPTIDKNLYCSGKTLKTTALAEAIHRADALFQEPPNSAGLLPWSTMLASEDRSAIPTMKDLPVEGIHVVIATHSTSVDHMEPCPTSLETETTGQGSAVHTARPQIIRFGKGIHWLSEDQISRNDENKSPSVLPCVLGSMMEGPLLLAIGEPPMDVPFSNVTELHEYYRQAQSIVVLVDENMTDNARNVAPTWRLNGLFVLQTNEADTPDERDDVAPILNKININAVTALAGPQSLIVVQIGAKYFFYRGIANPQFRDASNVRFGQDITEMVSTHGLTRMAERAHLPSWPRLVDLAQDNSVHLSKANRMMRVGDIEKTFQDASVDDVMALKDDITMIVPQLQALLPQEKLQEICRTLIRLISAKVNDDVETLRRQYSRFVIQEFDPADKETVQRKNMLLSNLRKESKEAQNNVQWFTTALGNVMSTQTTSSRKHDLKRLARQAKIQSNVDKAKAMTFEKLAGVLEEHASQMGALLVNVRTDPYTQYISESLYLTETPSSPTVDICFLDPRILYLEGLDAGIVLQASQAEHSGPLASQRGREHPILALPYLNNRLGRNGSMLAWVCWDEFVQLRNPYMVRWMEKCNDPNIAALRIIMRSTLSKALSSRNVTNLSSSSQETGQLMGALLMTAMRKLAETRSTIPTVSRPSHPSGSFSSEKPDSLTPQDSLDTSILLMRGLFGNLLTVAGSGTRPLSYVWQLFGKAPTLEIPASSLAWTWYENTTRLLPYTGWPVEQYKINVVGLLDKLIFRMMTRSEKVKKPLSGSTKLSKSLQSYCKARNIQLLHSRTIITILEKMLTEQNDSDCQSSAQRLLQVIPEHVENETTSYTRLYRYIQHLAGGGKQHSHDNIIAANVFTKRSAVFGEGKQRLAGLLSDKESDQDQILEACQRLFATKAAIEKTWGVEEGACKMQNAKAVQEIFDASQRKTEGFEMPPGAVQKALSDAEINRRPWQIGDKNEFGEIEKLDEKLMAEVLEKDSNISLGYRHFQISPVEGSKNELDNALVVPIDQDQFLKYQEGIKADFLQHVKTAASVEDVCRVMGITAGAMEAFVAMLVPDCQVEVQASLPLRFKHVVLMLLRDRCRDAEKVKPTRKLLGIS